MIARPTTADAGSADNGAAAACRQEDPAPVPPITELTRIEPVHLDRLEHQGVFTTGILLEVSETPTRRQTLADQVAADTNDVLAWRDEALMLNLAGFGPAEHDLLMQGGIEGLRDILDLSLDDFRDADRARGGRAEGRPADRPHDRRLVGAGEDARGRLTAGTARRHRHYHAAVGSTAPRRHRRRPDRRRDGARDRRRVAIVPFLSPPWVAFEQGRAEAAAWTGFSEHELRVATDAILPDLVIGPATSMIDGRPARPLLNERERPTCVDVRGVFAGCSRCSRSSRPSGSSSCTSAPAAWATPSGGGRRCVPGRSG